MPSPLAPRTPLKLSLLKHRNGARGVA